MRMGQGVRTGLGHVGITCVLQTQFSSFLFSSPRRRPGRAIVLTWVSASALAAASALAQF